MMQDRELVFSESQAITGPALSADAILLRGLDGIDKTRRLRVLATVEAAFSGSATGLTVDLVQADNPALTSNVDVLGTTGMVPIASLVPDIRLLDQPLPRVSKAYVGFRYTPQGGTFSAGVVTAGLAYGTDTHPQQRPPAHSPWN